MKPRTGSTAKQRRKTNQPMAAPVRIFPQRTAKSGSRPPSASRKSAVAAGSARQDFPKPALDRAAVKRGISLLLPFAIFLFLGLLLIWERVKVNQLAAEIATMEVRRNQLAEQNGKLRIQVEQLSSYARISRLAARHLGMVTVSQEMVVVEDE
jgi:cell division protein FtsL